MGRAAFLQPLPVATAFLGVRQVELFDFAEAPAQHTPDFPMRMAELSLHRTSFHPLGTPPRATPYRRTRRSCTAATRNLGGWEPTSRGCRQTRRVIPQMFETWPEPSGLALSQSNAIAESFARGDPFVDLRFQQVERQRALVEHRVMKGAQIEFRSQLLLRAFPQFENFHLAHLVGERLRRPRYVTIDFSIDVLVVHGGVLVEEIDHLLARPVLRVDTGVYDPTHGAPHFILQAAVVAVRVLIKAHFFSQALGVERPAFAIRIQIEVELAERRQAGEFLRDRKLQVMSGDAFVVGDGFDVKQQSLFGGIFVDVDAPRTRTISG